MNKRILAVLLITMIMQSNIIAQILIKSSPKSFLYDLDEEYPVIEMPKFDIEECKKINSEISKNTKKMIFAKSFTVNIDFMKHAKIELLPDGQFLARMGIKSTDAKSINLILTNYRIPPDATLFIYDTKKRQILGAITDINNNINEILATLPVIGDEIVIEYFQPANSQFNGNFIIEKINHDYIGIMDFLETKSLKKSGDCNININCQEGDEWQIIKRSVGLIIQNGTALCSGSLINNTNQDGKPYFLTANHCIDNQSDAAQSIFVFNYESPTCENSSGSMLQSISGSNLIATPLENKLDFTLLELTQAPPDEYQPYYAGWNLDTIPPDSVVCIHHPSGDMKKITYDKDSPISENYGWGYDPYSHWKIIEWDGGTTEGGSSGSPLFNEKQQIIGNLTGGDASCSFNFNDFFSKISRAWFDYPPDNQNLKKWLDPIDTQQTELNGYDPLTMLYDLDLQIVKCVEPASYFCKYDAFAIKVVVKNKGHNTITKFKIKYLHNNQTQREILWTGNLTKNETDTITFEPFEINTYNNSLKFFVSEPNDSLDQNIKNDTLTHNFLAYLQTPNPVIEELNKVCKSNLLGTYKTNQTGQYYWTVTGGQLITANYKDFITIQWDSLAEKNIKLKISDGCGTAESNIFRVKFTQHNIVLELTTDNNGSETSWYLTSQDGTVLYSGSQFENNSIYKQNICLSSKECYKFVIMDTGNNGLCCQNGYGNFSLFNTTTNKLLASGSSDFRAIKQETFCLEEIIEIPKDTFDFKIYPNPVFDYIKIEKGSDLPSNINIYDITGRKIYQDSFLINSINIPVNNFRDGIYIIELENAETSKKKKIIVAKTRL